jgi:probable rRNA maturation factor
MSKQLHLAVQYASSATGLPTRPRLRRWVVAALQPDTLSAEITLRIVDADEGLQLNRDYRGKAYATNVLTFTYDDGPVVPGMPLLGDIVLCTPVVAAEAEAQGKPLLAHYAHLVVHGVLHLQGFDHEEAADADRMEALETQIVTKLGYADPYVL